MHAELTKISTLPNAEKNAMLIASGKRIARDSLFRSQYACRGRWFVKKLRSSKKRFAGGNLP